MNDKGSENYIKQWMDVFVLEVAVNERKPLKPLIFTKKVEIALMDLLETPIK